MAKKKLAPHRGGHTEGPFEAYKSDKATYPWRVVAGGITVAVIQSGRPRGDAERIAASLNAFKGTATAVINDGVVGRMWLALRHLADLVEGVQLPIPPEQMQAFREQAVAQARAALAAVVQHDAGEAKP